MEVLFAELMPHHMCFLPQEWAVPYYILGNGVIGMVYVILTALMAVLHYKKKNPMLRRQLKVFGSFILTCGLGHWLMVWNLYHGMYVLEAMWHILTAFVSVLSLLVVTFQILPLLRVNDAMLDAIIERVSDE